MKFVSAENGEGWATAHFQVPVVIENSLSRQRFQVPCRDTRCSVVTGAGIRQDISVATEHGMSRQCRAHDSECVR